MTRQSVLLLALVVLCLSACDNPNPSMLSTAHAQRARTIAAASGTPGAYASSQADYATGTPSVFTSTPTPCRSPFDTCPLPTEAEALGEVLAWFPGSVIMEIRQVSLAEAKQLQSGCGVWMGFSNTYWMVNTFESFENQARPMRVWLSVTTGEFCREPRGAVVPYGTFEAARSLVTPTPTPDIRQAHVPIYAAVVNHLAVAALPPDQTRWPVVFICPRLIARLDLAIGQFDNTPVPPGLTEALRDLAPRIELAEPEAVLLREQSNRIRDDGLLVTLGPLLFQPDGTVKLTAERLLSGQGASGYEYHLARDGNSWRVIEASLRWKA